MVSSPRDPEPEDPRDSGSPVPAWDRRAWAWLAVVLAVAAVVLLVGLGGGTMRPYDEGLYGKLARNALAWDRYLYAVGHDGELYPGFSKPPLSFLAVAGSFHAFGVSMTSLRLPFALSMLATTGVAFAWGRRIAGVPHGLAWAGVLLMSAATFRWGRVACIEPMLMLFVLTGLWAYHEAMLRRGLGSWAWALLAALALCGAVATKQVVVGLAALPIVLLELWRWRPREALPRLLLVLGLPAATGLAWLWAVAGRVGESAYEIYVRVGVMERVEGYSSGTSARSLNELSGVVAEACDPFPWALGVAGLVVLTLMRPTARERADGALLLPLLLLTTVLVFDNLSGSMRPWYAYNLVVPLTGGMGFAIAGLVAPAGDRLGVTRAVAGALTLAVGALGALADVVSQLDVAILVGLLLVFAWRPDADGRRWTRARLVLLAAAALAFVLGTAARPELRTPPGGHEQLMERLATRGIERVDVDTNTQITGEHAWGTYYGPHADFVTRAPWRSRSDAEAYVTGLVWPTETIPNNGSEVMRAPGVMALIGHLDRAPWHTSTLDELLYEGPLTFEGEHLPSQRTDVVTPDPKASGGLAAAVVPGRGRPHKPFLLAHGPGVRLPKGVYNADFMLRVDCGGLLERPTVVLQVVAGRKSVRQLDLECEEGEPAEDYAAVTLPFTLSRMSRIELRVKYVFGEVWFDRVVVRRGQ